MSPRSFVRPIVAVLFACAPLAPAAPVPRPGPKQLRQELDKLWTDMLSGDEQIAGRAMLRLASKGGDAVEYLRKNLRPLTLSKQRAIQLLDALGGGNEKVARAAFEELRYFDPRLALDDRELQAALLKKPSNRILGAVLCDLPMATLQGARWHWYSPDNQVYRFNLFREGGAQGEAIRDRDAARHVAGIGRHGRKATWDRAVRAIVVLEFVGGPKALAVLDEMASGHPDAAPTRAARLAGDRLRK